MAGGSQVDRAIEVLFADFTRQGGRLDIDQANRVLERRGLHGDDAAKVLRVLAQQGVEVTGVDPATLGFEPAYSVQIPRNHGGDGLDALGVEGILWEEPRHGRELTSAPQQPVAPNLDRPYVLQ